MRLYSVVAALLWGLSRHDTMTVLWWIGVKTRDFSHTMVGPRASWDRSVVGPRALRIALWWDPKFGVYSSEIDKSVTN